MHYESKLLASPHTESEAPVSDPNQLEWDVITSIPYLTAQPQA
jgi:hypothetical protein